MNGDEKVLDLGCGHGAVLIAFAKRLTARGHADGIDLWRSRDQSNNTETNTQKNLQTNHVQDRTSLITANMVSLPFENNTYDYVVSSFAFHNIKPTSDRKIALVEACRVLKPGGTLMIVDTEHKGSQYVQLLKQQGLSNVSIKQAGFNGWWSGPWMNSYIITAKK
ncbi:class I SAM-dependent methyltransferase [Lentilactobacillus parakefiri]|uniref:class I SAM-dependent methyltransferase n=1 Tax=Lentilactobacillus parakefiri TaxID=152332 RepID=UPI001CDAE9EE|nr:class I SAM-dependent methyltransferase [Lentilactobacillus parakefiri]